LDWLVEALASNAKPAIVATHVPMSKQAMTGNHYFENNNQSLSTYPDHARVRAAVEATGKAAVWISGHVHWNSFTTIRGIHHLTMQSFSERSMTFPNPAEAYGLLEIGTDSITYQVFGRDPLTLKLPFSRGPMGHRRLPIPAVDPR
jgi:predicted phosphodiesterase